MSTCNKAPAPNRRPRFPLGGFVSFMYLFCAPPASPAAAGEARRWVWSMHSFLNRVFKREASGMSTPWDGPAVRERYSRSLEAGERGFQKLFAAKKPTTANGQVFYDLCLAELDWRRQLLRTDCFGSREAFLAELRRLVAEPVRPSSPPYSKEGYFKSQRTDIEVDIYNLTLHEKT